MSTITTLPTAISPNSKGIIDTNFTNLNTDKVEKSTTVNGQALSSNVVLDADDISDTSTTKKFTTASDISKLAGIEAGADVTDTTNVANAGAFMKSADDTDDITESATKKFITPTQLLKVEDGVMLTSASFDSVTTGGRYGMIGTPTGGAISGECALDVTKDGTGRIFQIATYTSGAVYVRVYNGSVWSSWNIYSSGGVTDHGALTGLADDDHTQYTKADGTRAFTGKVSYSAHPTFTSDTELVDKKYVDDSITASGGYTDEQAQDAVGTILADSSTIDFTYNDVTPSITGSVIDGSITTTKLGGDITTAGKALLDDADASAQRTTLGLNTTANQTDSTDKRFMTDAQEAKLDAITGTNTGDQTSIVGITGTVAQFNTALTDGDFATLAGTETLTNKTLSSPVINTPTGIVKGDVGLGNVDNTSDATKNSATATLTNKRITKRVETVASSATPASNTDSYDVTKITSLATAITSMTSGLTGTPNDGDMHLWSITDNGTARAITWGASFEASTVALPTTTVISTRLDVLFVWNSATSKWRCVGVA